MKYYTGIGSRETPQNIIELMEKIAYLLYFQGWLLRSGAAEGADTAFEYGYRSAVWRHKMNTYPMSISYLGSAEIYLPWKNFLKNRENPESTMLDWKSGFYYDFPKDVEDIASKLVDEIHPAPHMLTYGARKLHMRNCYQVLGQDLNSPSSFVVCWTKDGKDIGGTRTAIMLARKYNIPVCNLGIKENEIIIRGLLNLCVYP